MDIVANNEGNGTEKLFNFRPLLFAAIFLSLGITFGYFYLEKGYFRGWLFFLLPSGVVPLCFAKNLRNFALRFAVCLALASCFFVGFFAFTAQVKDYRDCEARAGVVTLSGRVENKRTGEYTTQVQLSSFYLDGEKQEGVILVYLPTSEAKELRIADRIFCRGEISMLTDGFFATRLQKTLRYRLDAEEYTLLGRSKNPVLQIRSRMERVLYAGMDETPAALTLGLLTGDMSGVDDELNDNMRAGGISHLFAVSGLNVGALFVFCLFFFQKTGLRRTPKPLRFLLMAGALLLYAAVCCYSASVMRATLLCLVGYLCKLSRMGTDLLEGFGASAILLLLLSPCQLFDVGFQLSFAACFGLVLLAKPIGQVFDEVKNVYRKRFPRKYTEEEQAALSAGDSLPKPLSGSVYEGARGLLSATLAAQIATLPLLIWHFDFVSGWALLLNFIFVPLIDGIFTALLLVTLLCCILPVAWSGGLLYLPSVVWTALVLVFEVVDFSTFALTGIKLTLWACVCYSLALTFLSDKWNVPKGWRWSLFFLLAAGCAAVTLLANS